MPYDRELWTKKTELVLERPLFYSGTGREFESNRIYISLADRLPLKPVFGNDVVIICIGGNPPVAYLTGECVCFLIKDNTDLFTVFNLVQQIFDKYDEWDAGLQNILNTTASIGDIVGLSFPVFENPIIVIDPEYRVIAYSDIIDTRDDLAIYRPDKNGNISLNAMSEYISNIGNTINIIEPDKTEPFLMAQGNSFIFSINLFVKNIYTGNLTIPFVLRQHRPSDIVLAQYLAKVLESTFKKHSKILNCSRVNILRGIFKDLLNCLPIDLTKIMYLADGNFNGQYICIKMKLGDRSRKVPVDYICNIIEDSFSGCVAFEYESAIVTFIDLKRLPYDEKTLSDVVKTLLREMHLKAGVSYSFSNLSMARLYYRQACVALEIGSSINPDLSYYQFHDYVLPYMMSHCLGEFPIESLLTKGIRRLLEHDLASQVNYVNTLRTYLNNNMNITKTAKELFLHRSTLLERLKRIESLLETDLEDPNQRLRLLISLEILKTVNVTTKSTVVCDIFCKRELMN